MLYLTLVEGDYALIGSNVKVVLERIDAKDRVFIGIEAPKDIPVVRSQIYEQNIAEQAALTGDKDLEELSNKLSEQRIARRRKYHQRQNSRAEYERRLAAGEIEPANPKREQVASE